jgi:hypothetical protein
MRFRLLHRNVFGERVGANPKAVWCERTSTNYARIMKVFLLVYCILSLTPAMVIAVAGLVIHFADILERRKSNVLPVSVPQGN